MLPIECPNCHAIGTFDWANHVGHSIRCPWCGHQDKVTWTSVTCDPPVRDCPAVLVADLPSGWIRREPEAITR